MDGLIQGVMFVGQDKNKTTSLMKEKSLEDICYLTRFLCLQLDKDSTEITSIIFKNPLSKFIEFGK